MAVPIEKLAHATLKVTSYYREHNDWHETMTARRFVIERDRDATGVSRTGRVAEGIVWTDGTVDVHWLGAHPS
jgi:hypothetical protein